MPRHKVRRPWLDYLVYLAVRLVVAFAQVLTIEQSYALARLLAWVLYRVDARHREVGHGEPPAGVRRPLRPRPSATGSSAGSIVHFCMMLMEILHIPRKLHPTTWRDTDHAGRPRAGPRPAAHGRAGDHADRPFRQLGDGRLPLRRLRLPDRTRWPGRSTTPTSTASSARSASGPARS